MSDDLAETFVVPTEPDAALRESQEILHLLVERVEDYAIFLIDASGHIASWNRGAERIKGYRANEIIGQPYEVFFTPEDRAAGRPHMLLERARREGRVEDEGWRVRQDGTLFWADAILTALYDEDGRLRGFAKVTRDLTERRRLEAERAAREAAELAVRQRDEFLSVAAHELKTPVTGIRSLADLALRRVERSGGAGDPTQVRSAFGQIAAQSARLGRLVERLLDRSRIEDGRLSLEPGRVDLVSLTHEAVATAGLTWPDHRFSTRAPGALWLEGDDLRLEQVLANLLDNAAKYSPPGSTVAVEVEADGSQARLTVRDRGNGMPEAERSHLFECFYRGRSTSHRSGLGLGLYVSRQIVELHGGTIDAEFPDDGGTQMVVSLPLAGPRAALSTTDAEHGERPRGILVVEDDALIRETLVATLEEEGYVVHGASNGTEALVRLAERGADLILLDMRTPVLDGWGFARAYHATSGPHAPIVVVSAATDAARHVDEIGAAGFLAKPFTLEDLLALVRRFVPAAA